MAILSALTTTSNAQTRRLPAAVFGIMAGYDYGFGVPTNSLSNYSEFSSKNTAQWVGFSLTLPKLVFNGFGLSTTWSYGVRNLSLNALGTEKDYQQFSSTVTELLVRQQSDIRAKFIQGDLMIYGQIGDLIRLEVGPTASIGFMPSYDLHDEIVAPVGSTFDDGTVQHSSWSATDPNGYLVEGGLAVRASLEIPISSGLSLLPFAQAKGGGIYSSFSDIRSEYQRGSGSVAVSGTVGIGLLFGNTNGVVVDDPPPHVSMDSSDRVSALEIPVRPVLDARVDLYSSPRDARRSDTFLLTSQRTLHRMRVPLVPVVDFESKSAALSSYYASLTPATRSAFTLDGLAARSLMELHRQGLNVIGLRMSTNVNSSITLLGTVAPGEPAWFASARARAVQDYLTQTWGIARDRVRIVGNGRQPAGNAHAVIIASTSPELMAPIVTEWIEEQLQAPAVGIEPAITAAAGVQRWRATVIYDGEELGVLRRANGDVSGRIDAGVVLRNVGSRTTPGYLNAELIVEDQGGNIAVARDSMLIVVDSVSPNATNALVDRSVTRHLVADDDDAAAVISAIAGGVHNGANVTISPILASNAGNDERRAGNERAAHIADELRRACGGESDRRVSIAVAPDDDPPADTRVDGEFASLHRPIAVTVVDR